MQGRPFQNDKWSVFVEIAWDLGLSFIWNCKIQEIVFSYICSPYGSFIQMVNMMSNHSSLK
jgi:hypothetical protein